MSDRPADQRLPLWLVTILILLSFPFMAVGIVAAFVWDSLDLGWHAGMHICARVTHTARNFKTWKETL